MTFPVSQQKIQFQFYQFYILNHIFIFLDLIAKLKESEDQNDDESKNDGSGEQNEETGDGETDNQ